MTFSPNVRIATLSAIFQLSAAFRPTECLIAMRNPYCARFHAAGYPLATSVPFVVPLVGEGVLLRKSGPCPQHGDRVLPSK
jgi:hypothetical protein